MRSINKVTGGLFAESANWSPFRRPAMMLPVPAAPSRRHQHTPASLPVLRPPHDHHRDLSARPHATRPARQHDEDRHLMMVIAASLCRNAHRLRLSSNGHDEAGPDIPAATRSNCTAQSRLARPHQAADPAQRPRIVRGPSRYSQMPHPRRSNPHSASRQVHTFPFPRFPPWRLSDARRQSSPHRPSRRHPTPFTKAAVRRSRTAGPIHH